MEQVQRKANKMIREMKYLSYEERLKQFRLFSLERRRPQGNLIAVFQYLRRCYKKGGERKFTRTCSDSTRGNGFKLKNKRFMLYIKKKFFTVRMVRLWNSLFREDMEVFKAWLDGVLSNLVK